MHIGTVNKLAIHTVSKRRTLREGFGTRLAIFVRSEDLKFKVLNAIEHKGRVYGIYQDKELVGIYIFEKIDDYFIKTEDSGVQIGEKKIDFEDKWFGESKAAFRLNDQFLSNEISEHKAKIEEYIRTDLSEQIEWGQIAGIQWGEKLIYRKQIDKKGKGTNYIWGYLIGFALGIYLGWMLFDSFAMGICFGMMYASLWGGVALACSKTKTEWASFDFVNKKYTSKEEEDATK